MVDVAEAVTVAVYVRVCFVCSGGDCVGSRCRLSYSYGRGCQY